MVKPKKYHVPRKIRFRQRFVPIATVDLLQRTLGRRSHMPLVVHHVSAMRSPSIILFLLFLACSDGPSAQAIVDRAIAAHGGQILEQARVEFDFREFHFVITRNDGVYTYERTYVDDNENSIREVLDNDVVLREVNGLKVILSSEEESSLLTPLNSVPYFALLPFNLNDPAAQKRILGETVIKNKPYYEIEVTFREKEGGRDFEDRFVYWFHKDLYTMDYLAYSFDVGDGGTRFREAYNVRTIGGVRFADYHNYRSGILADPGSPIEEYDQLLAAGTVELLSEINTENVSVQANWHVNN